MAGGSVVGPAQKEENAFHFCKMYFRFVVFWIVFLNFKDMATFVSIILFISFCDSICVFL